MRSTPQFSHRSAPEILSNLQAVHVSSSTGGLGMVAGIVVAETCFVVMEMEG